eukprot:c18101_g1_i1 orf=127-282(+)
MASSLRESPTLPFLAELRSLFHHFAEFTSQEVSESFLFEKGAYFPVFYPTS